MPPRPPVFGCRCNYPGGNRSLFWWPALLLLRAPLWLWLPFPLWLLGFLCFLSFLCLNRTLKPKSNMVPFTALFRSYFFAPCSAKYCLFLKETCFNPVGTLAVIDAQCYTVGGNENHSYHFTPAIGGLNIRIQFPVLGFFFHHIVNVLLTLSNDLYTLYSIAFSGITPFPVKWIAPLEIIPQSRAKIPTFR